MTRSPQVLAAVEAALDRPESERDALLVGRFADDPSALAEARALLDACARDDSFLDVSLPPHPSGLLIGTVIGGFRLTRHLASGGMGEVYEAEQAEPRRRVALKVMHFALRSPEALRRFSYEVEVLGRLHHPSIAPIFEAGMHRVGDLELPYFAMEYVDGARPLSRFVRDQRLGLPERLGLFRQVCDGVQYGHQLGVVHRDLKPANLLVGADGRPRIIDYGIARSLDADGPQQTVTGQVIGTVGYMSPEQIDDPLAVDTRTDVYALGVVLYELLADRPPFDLDGVPLSKALRIVVEQQPPSLRQVAPWLPADLVAIVGKAMAKEHDARYPTVASLLEDLHRYGRSEPVAAVTPSRRYLALRFVQRHRMQCTAAFVILASLAAGAFATYREYLRANQNAAVAFEKELAATNSERLAQNRLADFMLLRNVVQLADAKRIAAGLYPAFPERAPAMRDWLQRYGEPLQSRLPELEQVLAEMRKVKTLPLGPEQLQARRETHARSADLQTLEAKRADWLVRQNVSTGLSPVPEPELTAELSALTARGLDDLARPLVDPWEVVWGRAPEGLLMSRLALQKIDEGDDSLPRHAALGTLAWACLRCGLHEEAVRNAEAALAAAPRAEVRKYRAYVQQVRAGVDSWAKGRSEKFSALEGQIDALFGTIARESDYAFADDGDRFLHEALTKLVAELGAFVGDRGEIAAVRARLAEAESVRRRSLDDHRAAWDAALAVIAEEPIYRGLRLSPQVGLVPLGQDPDSRLFEFVHLASGAPGHELPARDSDSGRLVLSEDSGIVFVLVPADTFTMGAQKDDPAAANFDRQAQGNEVVRSVTVAPYFLGKFEITQAQWARLWDGEEEERWPSFYKIGRQFVGSSSPVTALNPVERVDWHRCALVMQHHGLQLPTEVQWEHACRAGSNTPWFTGENPASLAGYANVRDQSAATQGWGSPEAFDDGHVGPAPVGVLQPNRFGFHDMHGNVSEWCVDSWAHAPQTVGRMRRGGGFAGSAEEARSALREVTAAEVRLDHLGVRAARAVVADQPGQR